MSAALSAADKHPAMTLATTLVEPYRPQVSPLFADHLGRHGAATAVITAGGALTYAELDERVAEVAARLGGDRRLVLVAADNTADALTAYLAALRGGHPVLLAPADNATNVQTLITAYDPDVVISADHGWALEERRTVTVHDLHPDLALLLSTSGSTGSTKLVRLSRQNLHANAAAIAQYLGITAADRAITTLPIRYCYGLSVINSHLHTGAGLVLTELSVVDRCFWDLFDASGATSFAGVPHTFDLLDRVGFESMSLPTLRYVTQAGGRMHPHKVRHYAELGRRDGWDLFVMYGQTEATARMAYLPPALAASHPHTIGVPIPGGSFTIDSPDGDGVGELVYRGANVMLGYAGQPAHLALGPTVDALRTGDLARRSPDGLYEVVGRRSRFVKPYGLRIDLDRVERLLADHDITCVCTGDDELLVVAVECGDRDDAAKVVANHLALPRSHVRVLDLPDLPRLGNGKPDYVAVRRLAAAEPRCSGPAFTRTAVGTTGADPDVAEAVRAAFAEILGSEPSMDDSFVSLGGDSLSYVETSIRLEELLGTLPRDWHTTPIRHLVTRPARRRLLAQLDTSVVLRAVAMVLIVGTHAELWRLAGGAHTLLAITGYNFARFQPRPAPMLAGVARIAAPSMCWIGLVAAVSDDWRWPNAVLLNGWLGAPGDPWGYWYIEAIVQILVPLAVLFSFPAIRSLNQRAPFAVAVTAVTAGLLIRFDVLIDVTTTRTMSRPHEIFWFFALGWAAANATSPLRRVVVTALTIAAVPGFFASTPRELIVIGGILLVIWVPTLPMPRPAGRLIGWVAGASLYIYLTHFQLYPPLARSHGPAVAVTGSLLVGVAAWFVARRAVTLAENALQKPRVV